MKLTKVSAQNWQISGELNRSTLPAIWSELNQFAAAQIELDLAAVERTDSAGLAGLVKLKLNATKQQKKITYRNANQQLQALAAMSNVAQIVRFDE